MGLNNEQREAVAGLSIISIAVATWGALIQLTIILGFHIVSSIVFSAGLAGAAGMCCAQLIDFYVSKKKSSS